MSHVTKKIMYVVTEDWFFCSHFLGRAVAARSAGYEVIVVAREEAHGDQIRRAGLTFIPLGFDRRGMNPLRETASFLQLWKIYRRYKPGIVHHVALKPVLYGSLAALLSRRPFIVNAPVGMGFVFTSRSLLARILKPAVLLGMRHLLNPRGSKVIFENKDDLKDFVARGHVQASDAVLIRGAGVVPSQIKPGGGAKGTPLVVLVARLLWDKGIGEYVAAARLLRQRGIKVRCAVVGDIDPGNRGCIDPDTIEAWRAEGVIELWGFRSDIPKVLSEATIACLPSYREGLPKSLLEAMAAGLPCVTTDVPGCREAVRHEDNGLLVPAKNPSALADAVERLIRDPELARKMGKRGRERVEQEFSAQHVNEATLTLYQEMLGK
jgi:glycosyltransferase involved in cell wall biosynthesis